MTTKPLKFFAITKTSVLAPKLQYTGVNVKRGPVRAYYVLRHWSDDEKPTIVFVWLNTTHPPLNVDADVCLVCHATVGKGVFSPSPHDKLEDAIKVTVFGFQVTDKQPKAVQSFDLFVKSIVEEYERRKQK